MTNEQKSRFTVITNTELEELEKSREKERMRSYHTNPFYEKLVKFANGERKRFTVEDWLR